MVKSRLLFQEIMFSLSQHVTDQIEISTFKGVSRTQTTQLGMN